MAGAGAGAGAGALAGALALAIVNHDYKQKVLTKKDPQMKIEDILRTAIEDKISEHPAPQFLSPAEIKNTIDKAELFIKDLQDVFRKYNIQTLKSQFVITEGYQEDIKITEYESYTLSEGIATYGITLHCGYGSRQRENSNQKH